MSNLETAVADLGQAQGAEEHQAASRRLRIREIDAMFGAIPVQVGTQQAGAIATIRDRARVLALTIEERCPDGPEKTEAIHRTLEAAMWAIHAVSHR